MASFSVIITLIFGILVSQSQSKLLIYGPEDLKDQFKNQTASTAKNDTVIVSNFANFGHIPYGQSILGQAYYDPKNNLSCEPFQIAPSDQNKPDGKQSTSILLVDRGDCTFVTKARNAEHAGASLMIVLDNYYENITNIIMSDDGTGNGIRIPSLLVGRSDGELLKKAVQDGKQVTLSAQFILENPTNEVNMELWYSSYNTEALDFIKEFDKTMHKMEDHMSFRPHFVTWNCEICGKDYQTAECVSDGKYCAPNHMMDWFTQIKGRDIILEDLREQCLHKSLKEDGNEAIWWDYMKFVHQECFGFISEECSILGHEKIEADFLTTKQCVADSFDGQTITSVDDDIDYNKNNTVLEENAQMWQDYGTLYWPSVVINKRTFRGDLTAENVLEDLCANYEEKPQPCIDFYKMENLPYKKKQVERTPKEDIVTKSISGPLLATIIVTLIVANILLIIVFRRCTKREMERDLDMQVSSAVSQYVALSKQKQSSNSIETA